jgi:iron complex transport system ATP-binding protein
LSPVLELDGVEAGYGARAVLRGVSLALAEGEVVGLVGPNGAGKSTLLRAAAGVLAVRGGVVRLDGRALATLARREVAKKVAWLPQSQGTDLAFRAREIVEMGRLPHLGALEPSRDRDRAAVDDAIRATGIEPLAERACPALSEGEKQRVLLARCLAQAPRLLLLDEPTASLDIRHAWSLMRVVRERAAAGAAVLAAIHDLALAARACDRVIVVADGRVVSDGAPEHALAAETIEETFGMRARVAREEDGVVITVLGASGE